MYGSNNMKKLLVLGWSVCSGIRWSVSTGNDGQFAPEIGGQFDRIFHNMIIFSKLQKYFKHIELQINNRFAFQLAKLFQLTKTN